MISIPNLRLNTQAGQHILQDEEILSLMVDSAAVPPNEPIIEPGAGLGALTEALAKKKTSTAQKNIAPIVAVERDTRFIPYLKKTLSPYPFVTIHAGDILTVFPEDLLSDTSKTYHVVGNIPYSISARLLRHVLSWDPAPARITFLIDNEVAKRVTQVPPNANLLSVSVAMFAEAHIIHHDIPPEAFIPPPKVKSAIVQLIPHKKPLASPELQEQTFRLIRKGFANRRKMLKNSINTRLLEATDIDPTRRPQTLSVKEWIALGRSAQIS